jgi:hypothetical protein
MNQKTARPDERGQVTRQGATQHDGEARDPVAGPTTPTLLATPTLLTTPILLATPTLLTMPPRLRPWIFPS